MNTIKFCVDGDLISQEFQSPIVPRVDEHISLASGPTPDAVKTHTYVVERVDHSFEPNGVLADIIVHLTKLP